MQDHTQRNTALVYRHLCYVSRAIQATEIPPLRRSTMPANCPIVTSNNLLQLLLRAELVAVSALPLAAVGGSGRETGLKSETR